MTNKAIVTFQRGEDFSPLIHLNKEGDRIPEFVRKAAPILPEDSTNHAAARFVGFLDKEIPGPNSIEIRDTPRPGPVPAGETPDENPATWPPELWLAYAPRDTDVFIVEVGSWDIVQYHDDEEWGKAYSVVTQRQLYALPLNLRVRRRSINHH